MTPLQVMQGTVEHLMWRARRARDPDKSALMIRASEIAAKVAPYLHPRLSAIEHTGRDGAAIEVRQIPDDVAERIQATLGIDIRKSPEETTH